MGKREWSFQKLLGIFTEAIAGNYHPIIVLSLALDYSFFEANVNVYIFHTINVVLHLINVVLLFLFTRGNPIIAFIVVTLFLDFGRCTLNRLHGFLNQRCVVGNVLFADLNVLETNPSFHLSNQPFNFTILQFNLPL